MGHKLAFHASGNNVKVKWIKDVPSLASVVEIARDRMGKRQAPAPPLESTQSKDDQDPATRLKKLEELRDAGLISDEEFASQRARILADI